MNTRLYALVAMGLLLLAGPALQAQDETSVVSGEIRGDVNGDGRITAADADAVRAYLVRGTVPEGRSIMPAGDANADGRVTAADAALISRYAAGVDVSRFPVGRRVGDERVEETDISRSKLTLFDCSTSAATGATSCRTVSGGDAAMFNIIVGTEGVQLDTSGTIVSNGSAANPDTVTWTWTLTNKMAQPIGTTDGVNPDPSGSRLFFVKLPYATAAVASNTRPLKNLGVTPVGTLISTFTSAQGTSWTNRQYYQFDGVLMQDDTASRVVSFVYDARVTTFSYQLLLATPVPFDLGRVILTPLADSVVRRDTSFTIPSKAVNHLAQDTADVLSWSSSNPAVASVDANTGLITTLSEGTTTITATDVTKPTRTSASQNIIVDRFPEVSSTTPADGAVNIGPDTDIVVNFTEAVTVSTATFELKCPSSGSALPYTIAGSGTAAITLTPDADLPSGTVCEVTVKGSEVEDVDTNDGPNFMPGQYVFDFEVGIQALNDAFGTTTTGNVRINSASTDPVFSVTANDKIGPSTTITFAGWGGVAGKTEQGGDVVMTTSGAGMGQFTYNPPAGYTGTDSLEYTIASGSSTASAKVALPVSGMIWFVNNGGAACTSRANGCGRLTSPYSTLAAFQAENNGTGNNPAAGDNIFLYESASSYTGPVTLLADQKLIGQDAGASLSTITSITPATGSDPLPGMNPGANTVTIAGASGGVVLGANNLLRGFSLSTTGGTALSGSNFGTPTIAEVPISATSGAAISLVNGTLNSTFSNVSSTNSTGRGISLTDVSGTPTFSAGSISGAAQAAFFVSGGGVAFTWPGSIGQANNAPLVDVQGSHTGALVFSGALTATNGSGLQFNAAQGSYTFSGTTTLNGGDAGVDITNGSGGTFTFGTGTAITNPTGTGFNVYGSAPTLVTYGGSITKNGASAGRLVEVGEMTGGTVTFAAGSTLSSTSTAGTGISFSNADGAVNFNGTVTLSGGDAGVDIVSGSSGAIVFGSGTAITNPSGEALRIFNGAGGDQPANVSFAGSITTNAGRPVLIEDMLSGSVAVTAAINATGQGILVQNNSGGTVTFSSATQTLNTGANAAVSLLNNTGATVNFTGGSLAVTTTTGAGLNASGGGTVNVTGAANTVASGTGTAVSIANTSIGGSGLTFRSVSQNGGVNAILLNTTGTAGGLTVTGSGSTAASGGTIQNTSGNAVQATSAASVNLNLMSIQPDASGVMLTNVSGSSSLNRSVVDYLGTAPGGAYAFRVANTNTNATVTLDGTTFQNKMDGTTSVSISALGNSVITFNAVDSNTGDAFPSRYRNLFGSGIVVGSGDDVGSTATVTANVSNTTFQDAPSNGLNNLELGVTQNATLVPNITANTFDKVALPLATVGVINLNATVMGRVGSNAASGIISSNTITNIRSGVGPTFAYDPAGTNGYVGMRVAIDNDAGGVNHRLQILNNSVTNVARQGLLLSARGAANNVNVLVQGNTFGTLAAPVGTASARRGVEIEAQTTATLKVQVANNPSIVGGTSGSNSALAIRAGVNAGATSVVHATVTGNTIANPNAGTNDGRFRAETVSGNSGTMCLDLRSNALESATKEFQTNNNGGTFNRNASGNTGTITTIGAVGAVASCTLPSF